MTRRKNPRVIILAIALLIGAIALVAREHRPSFLRPGLRLNAYVTTLDGNVSVVDLVKLRAIARIPVAVHSQAGVSTVNSGSRMMVRGASRGSFKRYLTLSMRAPGRWLL